MRRRLTLLVAATMCLALLAFVVPLALLLRTVAQDRATVAASADAQSLVSLVGTADPTTLRTSVEHVAAGARGPLTVFLADGSVLGTPVARTGAVRLAALAGVSRTVERADGREIVVAVLGRPDGTAVIRAFVPAAELTRGVTQAWLVLAGLGVALLLLGLLVADRLSRALVSPIADLSAVSHRLARADLTARARPDGPPELREVAGALNHLADRIQELLREEREQVADLSHRLRAPLTSLRLEAESLTGTDAARITARVDAMERAVTGLISEARHRPDADPHAHAECEAASALRERVAFWTVLAEDTGRAVALDITTEGPLPVGVPADELAAAVDALLGNVFAHTPDGTAFSVSLSPRPGGGAVLTVADDGPGLSADLARRGASLGGSTGLGLDIARRAAQSSGGDMTLTTGRAGGAHVTLELGPPRPPVTPPSSR
ncbi:sensor histidine kinase [Streptomyces tauricus]|uniref:sensor histidine kinase n=1 Tax=Streptomyces tauricus TaxID=68274 RepID=UPI0022442261|nr:HAMP domain-containing sensor histidine kinase [Streptomyces tauricus]MCW8096264.1 HAMP domain-containing histidine kinase [Streptomyces tauricus]